MDYAQRRRRLNQQIAQRKLDALVITHLPNIRYLIGFTGSAGVLIASQGRLVFFTDGRYTAQAKTEVEGARIVIAKGAALAAAAEHLKRAARTMRIGIEA